jgi:uncharacterized protein
MCRYVHYVNYVVKKILNKCLLTFDLKLNTLSSSPLLPNPDRAMILDALRGFALFGVLIDNLFGFTGWGFLTETQRTALPTWPADGLLGLLELTFIHGKFYSIFSLLFGIGFSIVLLRSEQKAINPLRIFYRRLIVLLLIGLVHILFLWEGDILFLYALLGMLLPLFRKCSDRTLLTWAILLILSPIIIDLVRMIFHFNPGKFLFQQGAMIDEKNGIPADQALASQYIFTTEDSWQRWRNWLEPGFYYRYGDLLNTNRFPKVLGMFLFGLYAGRKLLYTRLEENKPLFKKLLKWGLIIGIPTAIGNSLLHIDNKRVPHIMGWVETILYALSVVPLCLAYVSGFCLQWLKTGGTTKWKLLAPLGRMALTNYLMQTLIGIGLFYGVGLLLGGDIGPSLFFPIGIGIYLFQLLFSTWWLRYFNFGPLEWIWRMLTYGKWLPMIKK